MLLLRIAVLLCVLSVAARAQNPHFLPPKTGKVLSLSEAFLYCGNREVDRIFTDYSNLYQKNNFANYGLAMFAGGIMANTDLDREMQNWFSISLGKNMHSGFTAFQKAFGEGGIVVPITVVSAITYRFVQEKFGSTEQPCLFLELTDRTMRGYLVGFPALLTLQSVTGGSRPNEGPSYWNPFKDNNGVSGHAFIGAVPFITAAQMTNRWYLKGLFYTLSVFAGYSRLTDGAHYFSQVTLGWYLAYLSVRSVSATEGTKLPRGLTLFPVTENRAVGIGLHYRY